MQSYVSTKETRHETTRHDSRRHTHVHTDTRMHGGTRRQVYAGEHECAPTRKHIKHSWYDNAQAQTRAPIEASMECCSSKTAVFSNSENDLHYIGIEITAIVTSKLLRILLLFHQFCDSHVVPWEEQRAVLRQARRLKLCSPIRDCFVDSR